MSWGKLLVVLGFIWAVFLCCLFTWGGEAGQEAAGTGVFVTVVGFLMLTMFAD